jgi:hypothetical protein
MNPTASAPTAADFAHFDAEGRAVMVDVGSKAETARRAREAFRLGHARENRHADQVLEVFQDRIPQTLDRANKETMVFQNAGLWPWRNAAVRATFRPRVARVDFSRRRP